MRFSQTRELKFKSRLHNCVFFSSDEALQIGGLFHQGQFPYCSGYEARRDQHFPDFNLESIFITKKKPVWIRACPIVLLVNLQQLAIVRLNVGTSDCESRTFFIINILKFLSRKSKSWKAV